jgi:hypothetical protein
MHRRRPLILVSVVTVAGFSLLAAGCGGGGGRSPGVASVATTTTSTATATTPTGNVRSALVAFAQCMRTHGVPNFPDPQNFAGGNVKLTIHNLGPSRAAMEACGGLLPTRGGPAESAQQQRTQRADALSFARCMRGHGVTRFPDPTAQGQLTVEMVEAQGIDLHSPAVLQAVEACLPASHGALTPAKVRRALNQAGG